MVISEACPDSKNSLETFTLTRFDAGFGNTEKSKRRSSDGTLRTSNGSELVFCLWLDVITMVSFMRYTPVCTFAKYSASFLLYFDSGIGIESAKG